MTTWGIVWRVALVVLLGGGFIAIHVYVHREDYKRSRELFSNIRKRKRIVWLHKKEDDECKKN
jgi:hypothetical protein